MSDLIIGILSGEPGSGKSQQSMQSEEDIIILDMENRLEEKRKRFFPDRLITIKNLMKYDPYFNEDQIGSFNAFIQEVKDLVKTKEPPRTVVIDGIGDLRDFAHAKWAYDNNRKRASNPGDWEHINDLVRDTLFPLINWGRAKDVNIIFTSSMKDDYTVVERDGKKESAKCGRVPAHKDWVSYNVDLLVDMWQPLNPKTGKPTGQYMATVTKSPIGTFEEEITGKSLWTVLGERGL